MKNSRITLSKIYFSERMSEETNCFTTNVLLDGKLIGEARNEGRGGCTSIFAISEKTVGLLNEAKKYAESLPKIKYAGFGSRGAFEVDSDLESVVDILVEDWLKIKQEEKIQKKLNKDMTTAICVGDLKKGYEMFYWTLGKSKANIADMLKNPKGVTAIANKIADLKAKGKNILNTNLPAEIL